MIDQKHIREMESYVKEEDSLREKLIVNSRLILKDSKSAIYSIHRKDMIDAKMSIDSAAALIKKCRIILKKHPHLKVSFENALEEYSEACLFYGYVKGKIPSYKDIEVDPIVYLQALSDLTGELGRRAVLEATAKNKNEVQKIRDLIHDIQGILIKFDLRNGDLRKKADAIKWNLNKVEELLYDLKK
ncbi:MAG: translin family protein [Candidatus Woesearchaeota archaeon]